MLKEDLIQIEAVLSRIINEVELSVRDYEVTIKEARLLGLYFSVLEISEDLLFLFKNEKYHLVPFGGRSLLELTLDIENACKIDDYLDRLFLTTLKKADGFSKFVMDNQKELDPKLVEQKKEALQYSSKEQEKLKKQGVTKQIFGIKEKYKLSTVSEYPLMYWQLDRLSMEVHTDFRLILERYDTGKVKSIFENKGFVKTRRTAISNEDKILHLQTILIALMHSTDSIINKFKFKYHNSLNSKLELIHDQIKKFSNK